MTDRWHAGVRRRVRDADEVIVICGEHTAASERMNTELRIAQEENKPYLLLWGRRERMCSMPVGVKRTACMYSWTRETLVHLVARLKAGGFKLLDTQYVTPHLRTFGAIEVPRRQYHKLLEAALSGEGDFAALGTRRPVTGTQALAVLEKD